MVAFTLLVYQIRNWLTSKAVSFPEVFVLSVQDVTIVFFFFLQCSQIQKIHFCSWCVDTINIINIYVKIPLSIRESLNCNISIKNDAELCFEYCERNPKLYFVIRIKRSQVCKNNLLEILRVL